MATIKKEIFERLNISLAYLYGSYARKDDLSTSDVDIALVPGKKLNPAERFDLKVKACQLLSGVFKREVDPVVLDEFCPVLLKFNVLNEGCLVYAKSEDERIDFEVKALGEYHDFLPTIEFFNEATAAHYKE